MRSRLHLPMHLDLLPNRYVLLEDGHQCAAEAEQREHIRARSRANQSDGAPRVADHVVD